MSRTTWPYQTNVQCSSPLGVDNSKGHTGSLASAQDKQVTRDQQEILIKAKKKKKNSQYLTADIRTNNVVLRMTREHRKSGRHRCILLGTQDSLNMLSTKHYMKNTQKKWWASLTSDCNYGPVMTNMTHSLQRQLGTIVATLYFQATQKHKEAYLDNRGYWRQPDLTQEHGIPQDHFGSIRLTNYPEHKQRNTRILLLSSLSAKGNPNNLKIFRSIRELSKSIRMCPKHPAWTQKTRRCLVNKDALKISKVHLSTCSC